MVNNLNTVVISKPKQLSQQEVAIRYAEQGIAVFPCNSKKRPLTKGGFKEATTDVDQIARWWGKNPRALIGSPNDKFTVIDDDSYKACEVGKSYTAAAISLLRSEKVITDGTFHVRTKNGGDHYYYTAHPEVTRKLGCLPNIDLLGKGGYVILPDQRNYVCTSHKEPWDQITKLEEINKENFDYACITLSNITVENAQFKKEAGVYGASQTSKKRARKKAKMGGYSEARTSSGSNYRPKENINYATGEITFEMVDGVYDASKDGFEVEEVPFNEDGTLAVRPGMLTNGMFNWLFNNPVIQEKLVTYLGLNLPKSKTTGASSRSILPGHRDENPSMGTRWSEDGCRIIIRDFSNFFKDRFNQIDYNVVRLYRSVKHKGYVPRGSGAEHNIWFLKLLYDAKLIKDIDLPTFPEGLEKVSKSEQKILDGFSLLCGLKSLYSEWDGTTLMSDRFTAAWCNIDPSTGNAGKKRLADMGYLEVVGEFNCSKNSDIWKTAIFRMPKEKIEKVKLASPIVGTKTETVNEKETENMAGTDMTTSVELRVSPTSYEQIKNFAQDIGIDEECIPDRSEMFISLMHFGGIQDVQLDLAGKTLLMGDLQLDTVEGASDNEVLVITGESPSIDNFFWESAEMYRRDPQKYRMFSDELLQLVVMCSDYEGEDDLGKLETKLNEYTGGMIAFDAAVTRYETSDNMYLYIYDGKKVEH